MESLSNLKISSSLIRQTPIWFKLWLAQTLSNLVQNSVMRSPPSNLFKTQWWGHCCRWRKKPQKVRHCRRRCRCRRPIEPIKKVRQLGVRNPRKKKPIVYFCVVMAPLYKTQSLIRYWSPILTSGKQIKRLIFEVLIMDRWLGPLMILAWVMIWVSFVFNLYLWSGSVFVFGLCFFSFFFFVCVVVI